MSRKKISTTIYVTPEQSDRLKVLHERTKVPVAVYIREGIDLVLRQYAHLLPGQLPLVQPAAAATSATGDEKPRRREGASTRELPGLSPDADGDGDSDADDERKRTVGDRAEAQSGLDKVAAGAKK